MKFIGIISAFAIIVISCQKQTAREAKSNPQESVVYNSDSIQNECRVDEKPTIPSLKDSNIQRPKLLKEDYLAFFNDVLKKKSLVVDKDIEVFSLHPTIWNDDLLRLSRVSKDSLMSQILSIDDIAFMYEQGASLSLKSMPAKLISRKTISKEYVEGLMQNKTLNAYWKSIYQMGDGYYDLELPVFSLDKNVALLRYSYTCGALCAYSGTYIFRKRNGLWERIGIIGIETTS